MQLPSGIDFSSFSPFCLFLPPTHTYILQCNHGLVLLWTDLIRLLYINIYSRQAMVEYYRDDFHKFHCRTEWIFSLEEGETRTKQEEFIVANGRTWQSLHTHFSYFQMLFDRLTFLQLALICWKEMRYITQWFMKIMWLNVKMPNMDHNVRLWICVASRIVSLPRSTVANLIKAQKGQNNNNWRTQ